MTIPRSLIARLLRLAADLIDPRASIFKRSRPAPRESGPQERDPTRGG